MYASLIEFGMASAFIQPLHIIDSKIKNGTKKRINHRYRKQLFRKNKNESKALVFFMFRGLDSNQHAPQTAEN